MRPDTGTRAAETAKSWFSMHHPTSTLRAVAGVYVPDFIRARLQNLL
jgi:hypothetical protein